MEGKEITRFIAGHDHEFVVREVDDIDYGSIYKIYAIENEEPELVQTVYRIKFLPIFMQNIRDAYAMEDLNI